MRCPHCDKNYNKRLKNQLNAQNIKNCPCGKSCKIPKHRSITKRVYMTKDIWLRRRADTQSVPFASISLYIYIY